MVTREHVHLTRRERQIMDVLYSAGQATASDIHQRIPDSPSYSAVRALLKKLVDKGHVVHHRDGPRYVYTPVLPKDDAQKGAVSRLLDTFFSGSAKDAVVNLLGSKPLTGDDIDEIERALKRLRSGHSSKGKRNA